jgi:hypothetical protein
MKEAIADGRLKGLARGLAYQLVEQFGVLDRKKVEAQGRESGALRSLRGELSRMTEFITRLRQNLEPVLALADSREKISAYHDMPYAIFHYDPEEELVLRREVGALQTRLENKEQARYPNFARRMPR